MTTVVIMPGGFHPFHAGHLALYDSARRTFPDAEVYVAATNDTSARPFPFTVKEKLAKLAGVEQGHFVQVKSPFQAKEITSQFDPEKDQLIFVRSEKDADKPPQAGGTKKDGSPAYLQPLLGAKRLEPFGKHAYMAYLPTVEFGPGMTSATEIRTAWPQLDERRKLALVMSLYPKTQGNKRLANTVVKMLDTAIGSVTESVITEAVAEGIVYATGPRTMGINDVDLIFKNLKTNKIVASVVGNNDQGGIYELRINQNGIKPGAPNFVATGNPQVDSDEHLIYRLGAPGTGYRPPQGSLMQNGFDQRNNTYYGMPMEFIGDEDYWSFLENMIGDIMWEDDAIELGYVDRLNNGDLVFTKSGVAEAGPFNYGAKQPRKGTIAHNAMMKRKEQEKNYKPTEPKDQMVGTAKVTKGVAEGRVIPGNFPIQQQQAAAAQRQKDWDEHVKQEEAYEDQLKKLAAFWYHNDESPAIEKKLAKMGLEIGQDEGYDDEPGVFIVAAGDIHGDSYLSWSAEELDAVRENQGWAATLEHVTRGYIQEQDPDYIEEKWSEKYKRSINCNNPRGFSQRAHCQGRKK